MNNRISIDDRISTAEFQREISFNNNARTMDMSERKQIKVKSVTKKLKNVLS